MQLKVVTSFCFIENFKASSKNTMQPTKTFLFIVKCDGQVPEKLYKNFFSIRKEIYLFIQETCNGKLNTFREFFENVESLCEL